MTRFRIPFEELIDGVLAYYGENKDELDEQLTKSMDFDYNVIDSFDDSGNKIPQLLSHNAIFIDCAYLHKDLYSMVYDLALILKEHNYGLFVLARQRLN